MIIEKKYTEKCAKATAAIDLIVGHVTWRCTELGVALDDFVDGFEEIFFSCHLASCSDSEHSSFRTHRPKGGGGWLMSLIKMQCTRSFTQQRKILKMLTEFRHRLSLDTTELTIQNGCHVRQTLNEHESWRCAFYRPSLANRIQLYDPNVQVAINVKTWKPKVWLVQVPLNGQ